MGAEARQTRIAVATALALLALGGLAAGRTDFTRSLVSATVVHTPSTFAATALYSPSGLTATTTGCTAPCFKLSWTAPAGNGNGNGYVITGMNNGGSTSCPTSAAAYTTFVGSTTSTTFTDTGPIAQGASSTYACYLVQTGYNPAGGPPWSSVPTWTSNNTLPTVAIKLPIYLVQAGTNVANSGTGNVTATLPAASKAGNLLVFTGYNDSCGTCGFSGPAGWTRAVRVFNTGFAFWSEIWFRAATPAGVTSAQFTSSGSNAGGQLSEFGGFSGSTPLDKTGTFVDTTGGFTATVATSSATTVAGELAVTHFVIDKPPVTFTSPAGWTHLVNDGNNGQLSDYQVTASAAVISEQVTDNDNPQWAATIATFKPT
jgi:hypothetical protein